MSSSAGATTSTNPVSIALLGMPSNLAVSGSCTNTAPSLSLIVRNPDLPSDPMPERITTILSSFLSAAKERKKQSIGNCKPSGLTRSNKSSIPFKIVRS